MEQPDFIYFECPDCGFDSIQRSDFTGTNICPLCAGDSGHVVSMRMRTARDTDEPEGMDARKKEHKIEKIYVILSTDENGNNGIVAASLPIIGMTPLVTSRKDILERYKEIVQEFANDTKRTYKVVEFSSRNLIEEIGPIKNQKFA